MELRNPTEDELNHINVFMKRLPEPHRDEVTAFVSNIDGGVKGYHLMAGRWMIDDKAEMEMWDEWYCPTQDRAMFCPGPCPDGTPHRKIGD